MFYVFNRKGLFIAKSDLALNEDDLATRGEIAIKNDGDFINPILADKNKIIEKGVKPSKYHEWDGKDWVISPAKQTALFAEQKESLIAQLANKTDALKAGLLVGYPQTEIDSFYRQEKEALAWQADKKAETPMLKQIALLRGVPFEILVQKVIEKSEMFAMVIGAIIGQRQQLEDRILTATKPEELETIKNEVETWQLPNLS